MAHRNNATMMEIDQVERLFFPQINETDYEEFQQLQLNVYGKLTFDNLKNYAALLYHVGNFCVSQTSVELATKMRHSFLAEIVCAREWKVREPGQFKRHAIVSSLTQECVLPSVYNSRTYASWILSIHPVLQALSTELVSFVRSFDEEQHVFWQYLHGAVVIGSLNESPIRSGSRRIPDHFYTGFLNLGPDTVSVDVAGGECVMVPPGGMFVRKVLQTIRAVSGRSVVLNFGFGLCRSRQGFTHADDSVTSLMGIVPRMWHGSIPIHRSGADMTMIDEKIAGVGLYASSGWIPDQEVAKVLTTSMTPVRVK